MTYKNVFSPFKANDNEFILFKGAYYIKIFHQTYNTDNLFAANDELEALNTGTLGADKYSRLSLISEAFKVRSKYEFILHWPDLPDNAYYHWRQTNNPAKEDEVENVNSATGFEPIHNHIDVSGWGGLVKTTILNANYIRTYLDGSPGTYAWFFAIAVNENTQFDGIPAFPGQSAKECDLWLRIPKTFPFFNTKRTRFTLSFAEMFPFLAFFLKE